MVRRSYAANWCAISLASILSVAEAAAADKPTYCGTERWEPFIEQAAQRFEIPSSWVTAVMRTESAGCTDTREGPITSPAGAMGLMQLMPGTWSQLRQRFDLGADPYDPKDNILAGTAYLRELYDDFGRGDFLAAYHAGPKRYEEWLMNGRALPARTVDYLRRVGTALSVSDAGLILGAPHRPISDARFVERGDDRRVSDRISVYTPSRPLFVILRIARSSPNTTQGESPDVQSRQARSESSGQGRE
jgi:soluble lytic murein transglycosylase-like protein